MDSPTFKKQYGALNREQKEAVDSIEGPVMVIAGPGTGKTSILTLRIAQILRKTDTPPSGILAITYTDAGVKAMKQKLREIIGSRADEVRIHTFHSFAISVIRDYPDHFPHLSEATALTDLEARSLINRILEKKQFSTLRPLGRPDLYIDPILQSLSEAKKEAWTPEMVEKRANEEIERIKNEKKGELKALAQKSIEKNERTILFAHAYKEYEEEKKKKRKIDFDDMIFELELALKRDTLLLRLLQEQYLYLLVDEHQDTNNSQNLLILMIAEFFDMPNVFIVGDEKQAIYRFQGASVENFLKFRREWKNVKLIQLDKNYRSHQKILDAAFHLIEHNYEDSQFEDLRVELKAARKTGEKLITIVQGELITDTEEYLITRLKEILKKDTTAEIAIIVPTNAAVGRLKRLCENRGVKAEATRNIGIFNHSIGKIFFDLLSSIIDPLDLESLGKTVIAGLWGLSFEEQIQALKEMRAGRLGNQKPLIQKLGSLRKSIASGDPMGFLFELAEESGYIEKISREPERVEVWRGILEFAETILRNRNNTSDTESLMRELIAYSALSEQKQVKVVSGEIQSQVKIMTAHGSKGLEFDYVFLPYATESFWVHKRRRSFFDLPFEKDTSEDDVKDSRRLFYVALTRARKHVELLTHAKVEGGDLDLPLRFIDELGENNIVIEKIDGEIRKTQAGKIRENVKEKWKESYIHEAKRVLSENGLSVTALNHFLECPNMFLYRSVLKIPDLPGATAEKGTALHEALAVVFRMHLKAPKKIEQVMQKKTFGYLDHSFLKKFEIDLLKEVVKKEIPFITKGLQTLFTAPGNREVEKSISREFKKISLHGRLDLIISEEQSVSVFDYKARGSMSVAEIKGETKSAKQNKGAYFRQLVFYHYLLSGNSRYTGKDITASLIFLSPDKKGRIKTATLAVTKEDIASLEGAISSLIESVYSGKIMEQICEKPNCEWCSLRQAIV